MHVAARQIRRSRHNTTMAVCHAAALLLVVPVAVVDAAAVVVVDAVVVVLLRWPIVLAVSFLVGTVFPILAPDLG